MVDAINGRSARHRIDVKGVGAAAGRAAEVVSNATKATDPIVKIATVYEASSDRRLPRALEALKTLHGKAEFAQFGLHLADALTSDRPAGPAIDALFKGAEIAIGATTGLARFHPLLAMLDAYAAGLKMSVTLLENKAAFDRLLAERRERADALDAFSGRVAAELTSELLAGAKDAYFAAGGFVSFAYRSVLERAASPGARLSANELADTYAAVREVAAASRIFADAKAAARAEIELRAVSVGLAAAQIEALGRKFDAHVATLESRPTPGNRLSAAAAGFDRVMAEQESVEARGGDIDTRARDAFARVLTRSRGLLSELVALERRFDALPAFVLARRIRSQGLAIR